MSDKSIGVTASATADTSSRLHKSIRVLALDSSSFTRELLKSSLEQYGLEVVCSGTTLDEVEAALAAVKPEIVLVYCRCCAEGRYAEGMNTLRRIAEMAPSSPMIVLLEDNEKEGPLESFRAGAKGVFRRSQPVPQLVRCIQAVAAGQVWASSADLNLLLQAFASTRPLQCINANGENLLSSRERQVLDFIAEGLSNHEVAERLQISEHTVKNHLYKMYEKLGISTRVELILFAITSRTAAS
jgi:DNA-binding NarL/FixJ family response regulator